MLTFKMEVKNKYLKVNMSETKDYWTVSTSIENLNIGASRVILAKEEITSVAYTGLEKALTKSNTQVLLFGKPNAKPGRRMGGALAKGDTIKQARSSADNAASCIQVINKDSKN